MEFYAVKRDVAARLTAFGIFLCLFPLVALLVACAAIMAWLEFRHSAKAELISSVPKRTNEKNF